MTDTLNLTATDDDGEEPDDVVLLINNEPVASTSDDEVEVTPSLRVGIGPAALENDDYAQAWVRIPDGQTLELLAWGLIDSAEESPDGLELVLMDSDQEVTSDSGVLWEEPDGGIAEVEGPANAFVQLVNNTGTDLTPSSDAEDWAAANFEYEVS